MAGVQVSRHPLVLHNLALLRSRATDPKLFRAMVREIARLLFYEASQDLKLQEIVVETPLAPCPGQRVAESIALAPILRAGLGMAEAILELVPEAQVWHLGLYRDHETCQPVTYYQKVPAQPRVDWAAVIDPMLATGGSAVAAVDILKSWGLTRIRFIGLIGASEGVRLLHQHHPDVPVFLAALDTHLDDRSYIVPGLGDAGDRQFGT
jgi:uracil phosphoribosyltransferase